MAIFNSYVCLPEGNANFPIVHFNAVKLTDTPPLGYGRSLEEMSKGIAIQRWSWTRQKGTEKWRDSILNQRWQMDIQWMFIPKKDSGSPRFFQTSLVLNIPNRRSYDPSELRVDVAFAPPIPWTWNTRGAPTSDGFNTVSPGMSI